jgi:hypothetical protein
MLHEPRPALQPRRVASCSFGRPYWALLLGGALGGLGLACNVILGASTAVVLGGAGVLAAQCYDQVSVRVHDEAGVATCDAKVSVGQGDSFHALRPCYHASLTSGSWRFAAQRDGYEPAQIELTVPERKGACPHYTHSLELTLRRIGAPREAAPFASTKTAPATSVAPAAPRPRPVLRLGPPVGTSTPPASLAPAVPPATGSPPPTPASPPGASPAPAVPPSTVPPAVPPAAPAVPPLPDPREAP